MIDGFFAYLDPGIGATLAQLAIAGTAGIAAAAKLRMNRIKRRVSGSAEVQEVVKAAETVEETTSGE